MSADLPDYEPAFAVALDMTAKNLDPGLIAAYLREEARRDPEAFAFAAEIEPLWRQVKDCLRASVQPVTVTRGGMDRPDVPLLPLTGPYSPGEAW